MSSCSVQFQPIRLDDQLEDAVDLLRRRSGFRAARRAMRSVLPASSHLEDAVGPCVLCCLSHFLTCVEIAHQAEEGARWHPLAVVGTRGDVVRPGGGEGEPIDPVPSPLVLLLLPPEPPPPRDSGW